MLQNLCTKCHGGTWDLWKKAMPVNVYDSVSDIGWKFGAEKGYY